jgi:hypothetical protein
MNPQFVIQIPRGAATKCHVVVAITQQYGGGPDNAQPPSHSNYNSNTSGSGGGSGGLKDCSKSSKSTFHAIGFAVYEARPNMNRITTQFVAENVGG